MLGYIFPLALYLPFRLLGFVFSFSFSTPGLSAGDDEQIFGV
jgi:hypothetical protein